MSRTRSLFHDVKFYLTQTLSIELSAELQDLIEQHGGIVSSLPVGAMQLVTCEYLDSRHPNWVAHAYVPDSVSSGTLQDPFKYSGCLFAIRETGARSNKLVKRRVTYTVEDDARMLHFAKSRGWKSMNQMTIHDWREAQSEGVTRYSCKSMWEHFRTQLRRKTPMEQRDIMAKALEISRERLMRQEEEKKRTESSPIIVCKMKTEPTTPPSTTAQETPVTPATSSPPPRRPNRQQKRKRDTLVNVDANSSHLERQNDESGEVFFRSTWTELAAKQKHRLEAFFDTSSATAIGTRSSDPVDNISDCDDTPSETSTQEGDDGGHNGQEESRKVRVKCATEHETDEIVCQLQFETNQDISSVVHALYYSSGDVDIARAFLQGASPSYMWSLDDDLLLVNLVAEESIDRSAVDAAVARGDFAATQVPRDADAILDRVKFLR